MSQPDPVKQSYDRLAPSTTSAGGPTKTPPAGPASWSGCQALLEKAGLIVIHRERFRV
jgi:hypothetical protein